MAESFGRSPASSGSNLALFNLLPRQNSPYIALSSSKQETSVLKPKLHTTQEVTDILGLKNSSCLHKAKNQGVPYVHSAPSELDIRIALYIRRNQWLIFSPG